MYPSATVTDHSAQVSACRRGSPAFIYRAVQSSEGPYLGPTARPLEVKLPQ